MIVFAVKINLDGNVTFELDIGLSGEADERPETWFPDAHQAIDLKRIPVRLSFATKNGACVHLRVNPRHPGEQVRAPRPGHVPTL